MLLLTQPSEMQRGGLNGAFSEGTQHPGAGGSVLLPSTAQPKHLSVLFPLTFGSVRQGNLYMGPPLYTNLGAEGTGGEGLGKPYRNSEI